MKEHSVLSLIGDTPLVKVSKLDTGCCELFLKLENHNPGGSIKDRVALSMIEDAEERGLLKPGGTIIEATAGNTGLGLALVALNKGYRLILVIPDKMSREKISHLKGMGAKIIITRSDVGKGHPEYYQDIAERITAETPGAFYINQFNNPANPLAHSTTTGPEIWKQMNHEVDAIVAGVGSGGTLAGLSQFFAKVSPHTEMVLADPKGSILADYIHTGKIGEAGSWLVEGIGEDFIPGIADLSRVKKAYTITDQESFATIREVLKLEGILGGSSSGTLIAAALRYCREQKTPKRVVTFICDSGNKYLSKVYNDFWMTDHGLLDKPHFHDLRDLISRLHEQDAVVSLNPNETLRTALHRMKSHDVSQLPVLENERLVGLLDESDLLNAIYNKKYSYNDPVKIAMVEKVDTLPITTPIDALLPIFELGYVAVIVDGERFQGLITRIDLLNYLREKTS